MKIFDLTAVELSAAIKQGKITCEEAVKQLAERIEKTDKSINSYITVCTDAAIERAKQVQKLIDSGKLNSPLAGVPVSIKDNICTKGINTTCASKMLENYRPPYNARVVDLLEQAGMIVMGKLNMDEFAMGSTNESSYFGKVCNPWDTVKIAGGSSGGAAAAVSSGGAVCALGTDSGGSIRVPSAYCSVTGFKPTYGTVSRYGLIAYASSFDQIGPIAKSVEDCAAIMDIIGGKDLKDSTTVETEKNWLSCLDGDIKGIKVAVAKQCFEGVTDGQVASKVLDAVKQLSDLGAQTEFINLPYLEYTVPVYYTLSTAEASSNLARFDGIKYGYSAQSDSVDGIYALSRADAFGREVKSRILLGTYVLSSSNYDSYYIKALKIRNLIKRSMDEIFSRYDVIISPTVPKTACPFEREKEKNINVHDIFTGQANLAGLPALTVPCGFDNNSMPVGMQITGNRFSDKKVLNVGYAYQQHTDFHLKRPEVKV